MKFFWFLSAALACFAAFSFGSPVSQTKPNDYYNAVVAVGQNLHQSGRNPKPFITSMVQNYQNAQIIKGLG